MQLLTEIRIAGFGGQGVILAAAVVGKACAIFASEENAFPHVGSFRGFFHSWSTCKGDC